MRVTADRGDGPMVIYVAGSGRSGSTLLDRLLDNHPRVRGVGEVHRLTVRPEARTCACGEPLLACPFWSAIVREVSLEIGAPPASWLPDWPVSEGFTRAQSGPSVARGILTLGSTRLLRAAARVHRGCARQLAVGENSWRLYDVIARSDHVDVVVDSTKNAGRMKLLYLLRPGSLRILHLVRDGRAVASSARRRTGASIKEGAADWKRANRNVELALATVPRSSMLRVRYEDLCDRTDSVLSEILEFAGLRFSDEMVGLRPAGHHQIPGNPMLHRLDHLAVVKDTRWRDDLDPASEREFDRVAGSMNRRYGYV